MISQKDGFFDILYKMLEGQMEGLYRGDDRLLRQGPIHRMFEWIKKKDTLQSIEADDDISLYKVQNGSLLDTATELAYLKINNWKYGVAVNWKGLKECEDCGRGHACSQSYITAGAMIYSQMIFVGYSVPKQVSQKGVECKSAAFRFHVNGWGDSHKEHLMRKLPYLSRKTLEKSFTLADLVVDAMEYGNCIIKERKKGILVAESSRNN